MYICVLAGRIYITMEDMSETQIHPSECCFTSFQLLTVFLIRVSLSPDEQENLLEFDCGNRKGKYAVYKMETKKRKYEVRQGGGQRSRCPCPWGTGGLRDNAMRGRTCF